MRKWQQLEISIEKCGESRDFNRKVTRKVEILIETCRGSTVIVLDKNLLACGEGRLVILKFYSCCFLENTYVVWLRVPWWFLFGFLNKGSALQLQRLNVFRTARKCLWPFRRCDLCGWRFSREEAWLCAFSNTIICSLTISAQDSEWSFWQDSCKRSHTKEGPKRGSKGKPAENPTLLRETCAQYTTWQKVPK